MDIRASWTNLFTNNLKKLLLLSILTCQLSAFLQPLLVLPAGQAAECRFLALPNWPLSLYTVNGLQKKNQEAQSGLWPHLPKHFTDHLVRDSRRSFSVSLLGFFF